MSDASEDIRLLHEMNGKLDRIIVSFDQHLRDDNHRFDTVGDDIKSLEKKTYWLTGIVAAIAVIGGKLVGKF
jgi:hypothetical protein